MTHATPVRPRQDGVVLIFSLIVLLILLIGAVALMRSMNTSLLSAGNLAFRRDLVNQGEQAVSTVINEFKTGGAMVGLTTANNQSLNYSATILATNTEGVPLALLNNSTFSAVGTSANDITGSTSDVQIRYVVDRLCSTTGSSSSALCAQSKANPTGGTGGSGAPPVTPPSSTVYRLSVRVSGARSTQVFLQTTFTVPGS